MSTAIKLGRIMTNLHGLLPIMLLYLFWSHDFLRSYEKLKVLYLHYHYVCDRQTWQGYDLPWGDKTHKVTWPLNHVVLQDPLRQSLWLSNLAGWFMQWGSSFHNVTQPFNNVVLQSHVKYEICCISMTAKTMTIKFGKVVTYYERLPPTTLYHKFWIRGHVRLLNKLKLLFPLPKCLKPPKLAAWWPNVIGSQS